MDIYFFFTGILKKTYVLLNILSLEVFFTDYCHIYPASYLPISRHVSQPMTNAAPDLCKPVMVFYGKKKKKKGKKQFLFIYGNGG